MKHLVILAVVVAVIVAILAGRAAPFDPPHNSLAATAPLEGIAIDPAAAVATPPRSNPPTRVSRFASREVRDRVAAQIASAQASRQGVPKATATDDALASDKRTIRAAMRDVFPFIQECYEEALPTLPSRDLEITASLALTGDPDIGTLVDAKLLRDGAGQPLPAELDECLRATLEQLELPALQTGDHLDVDYPFVFRSVDPADLPDLKSGSSDGPGWRAVPPSQARER